MDIDCHLIDKTSICRKYNYSKETCPKLYKNLLILRFLEEYLRDKYKSGKIRGFCHLVTGQENIYTSLKEVLQKEDKVIGSYRCHGLAYVCGISIEAIVAETFGYINGACKGKGGSMHLYNGQFYGGHGIVGAQVSLGTGLAFALQYQRKQNVSFVFYGDGASNQGQVFESFNMAMLWKLPVVYICENNTYGMWTPDTNVCSYTEYYKRGCNIPGIRVSDKDICRLINVLSFARDYALSNGPIIVQIDTYRFCGHSCADKSDFYRTKDEIQKNVDQDCLKNLRIKLDEFLVLAEVQQLEADCFKFFEKEVEKAEFGKNPTIEELYTDIYK